MPKGILKFEVQADVFGNDYVDIRQATDEQINNSERLYVKYGVFDIKILPTDDGVIVDIYSAVEEGMLDPIATTYAFTHEALPEEDENS